MSYAFLGTFVPEKQHIPPGDKCPFSGTFVPFRSLILPLTSLLKVLGLIDAWLLAADGEAGKALLQYTYRVVSIPMFGIIVYLLQ